MCQVDTREFEQIDQKCLNFKFEIATENFRKKTINPIGITYKLIILFNTDIRNFELIAT